MARMIGDTATRRDLYDRILLNILTGRTVQATRDELKCDWHTVLAVSGIYKALSDKNGPDWDKFLCSSVKNEVNQDLIEWASEKAHVTVPPAILLEIKAKVAEKRKEKYKKANAAKAQKTEPEPETAPQDAPEAGPEPQEGPAAPPPAPDHWNEEKCLLQTLIMAVKEQNELLEQLYDAVLPKWIGDLKDNHNANSDVQTQALKRIEDKLEAIKINVRRRGA